MLAAALVAMETAQAQSELSNASTTGRGGVQNTFVRDYQAIGVNPANLGFGAPTVSFTFLEGGLNVSSQAFTRTIIKDFSKIEDERTLAMEDRLRYAKAFTSDNVLNAGVDMNTFAIAVYLPKVGGFGFSNRQRILGHAGFNKNFSELLFLGQEAPVVQQTNEDERVYVHELFDGTELKASWVNEWNLSYGRKLVSLPAVAIYAGVGYRYLQGLALYELSAKDGEVKAYSASSPVLDFDYERYLDDPQFRYGGANNQLSPVGKGHGYDVGLSAEIAKTVKVSLSVTDMGSMRWSKNLLQGQDKGFYLSDIISAEEYDFEDVADVAQQIIDTALAFTPVNELKTDLPTRFRAGVGAKLGNKVEVGVDYVHALNNAPGNLSQDFFGLGVDVMPTSFFRFSTGVSTGAGEKLNLPIGIAFIAQSYEFGISTRDITAPLTENNPGASFAFAFLRFKIGNQESL
ncbi:hypothetical protein GCM10028895_41930 [Pontibacter rugosus]